MNYLGILQLTNVPIFLKHLVQYLVAHAHVISRDLFKRMREREKERELQAIVLGG